MIDLRIDISKPEAHGAVAAELIAFAGPERVFLFEAPMGAGKTTFIKALCARLGVTDTMSSPTYSVVNEYATGNHQRIYHFDLYRLKATLELLDIGFEEYLASGNYLFIEWPELAIPLIGSHVKVNIELNGNIRYLCAQLIPG
jgi:tRNA threonylcarbamoyladenosine biosynthesis protein TsaE